MRGEMNQVLAEKELESFAAKRPRDWQLWVKAAVLASRLGLVAQSEEAREQANQLAAPYGKKQLKELFASLESQAAPGGFPEGSGEPSFDLKDPGAAMAPTSPSVGSPDLQLGDPSSFKLREPGGNLQLDVNGL